MTPAEMSGDGDRVFRLRRAVVSDALPFSELRARVVDEGRFLGAEPPLDVARSAEQFTQLMADGDSRTVVAVDRSDRIVGAISMFPGVPGVVTFGMFVAPECRRQGIGAALVGAVIDWARGRGAHKVILEVWPHNTAAIELYTSCGFVPEGLRRRHYRRRNGELWDIMEMALLLEEDAPVTPGSGDSS
ncbi:GNAT family N-acetyltransferase [Gordonia rhizosphera]|uniref:Putative acetyltransferase n=1 Tax=Gordonia rhizosphera NBRC 16068 TaxID=1108045 RepID=K6VSN6_9ACTN|nr:GNAT family N-acetyltransferase [Gordonia rhizosphera]GAB89900.1 putative acetyltransferase [Gordonia rhizosphera NBRC 16068]